MYYSHYHSQSPAPYRHCGQLCYKDAVAQFTTVHRLLIQSFCPANQISQLQKHVLAGLHVHPQANMKGVKYWELQ